MQVRHILQDKGRDIIGIADSATLSEAARILAQQRIGARDGPGQRRRAGRIFFRSATWCARWPGTARWRSAAPFRPI